MPRNGNPLLGTYSRQCRHGGFNSTLKDALYNDIEPAYPRARENPRDRRICELSTQGYTNKEIATAMEMSVQAVSNILRQPFSRKYMIERVQQSANAEIKAALEKAAPEAVQRVIELAETARGTELGFKADQALLDRYMGKATQPLSVEPKDFDKLSDAELEKISAGGLASLSGNS